MVQQAPAEQEGQDGGKGQGLTDVGLHLHVVMNDPGEGGHISQAVERPPAFAPQPLDHGVGGGDRQRHQEQQAGDAHQQVFAFGHFRQRAGDAALAVLEKEDQEVQHGVKEGVQAEGAAGEDDPVPAADFAQGGDQEGEQQKDQRRHAGGENGEVHRVGAEPVVEGVPSQQGRRHGPVDEHEQPGKAQVGFFHGVQAGQKLARRSRPAYKCATCSA